MVERTGVMADRAVEAKYEALKARTVVGTDAQLTALAESLTGRVEHWQVQQC